MFVAPPQEVGPKWRGVAAAMGVGAAVVDALLYVPLGSHAIYGPSGEIVRFGTSVPPALWWYRIGVWLGVLAIVASGLGKGRLRKWGLLVGVAAFLLWLFGSHR